MPTKKVKENGQLPLKTRKGDGIIGKNKKQNIKPFIESLKCTESYYCRRHALRRLYVPYELNVNISFGLCTT